MINSYVILMLTTIVTNSDQTKTNVELSILGGHGCTNYLTGAEISLDVDKTYDINKECKTGKFIAELSIDGKIIGSIPLDLLSKEQIDGLTFALKGVNLFSKKEIEELDKAANSAIDKIK